MASFVREREQEAIFGGRAQAEAPWRFALVPVMHCVENLSDQRAADAVRGRIDGKSLLGRELTDPGCDASVRSACRDRLRETHAEERLLEKKLTLFRQKGWLKACERQRTASTHVVAKTRALNRVRCVWETMRAALNRLAVVAPDWLRAHSEPEWVERNGPRSVDSRSPVGMLHVWLVLKTSDLKEAHGVMLSLTQRLPSGFVRLRLETSCERSGSTIPRGLMLVRWCSPKDIPPPSRSIGSPSDEEAHASSKRSTTWVGDTGHLTERWDAHVPWLMTHGETPSIHADRDRTVRVPAGHIVEIGPVDATLPVESQREDPMDLGGPTHKNDRWQATPHTGVDVCPIPLDGEQHQATCPEGHPSSRWTPAMDTRNNDTVGKVGRAARRTQRHQRRWEKVGEEHKENW